MAIAFDSAVNGGTNGGSGTLSYSFTNTAGNLIVVGIAGDTVGGADDITGVTYNSVSLSLVGKYTGAGTGDRFTYAYLLQNVGSTGANTVSITTTGSHFLSSVAASWSGCATTGQPDASQVFVSSSTSPYTTSLTTVADNCWMVLVDGGSVSTGGTGATQRATGTFLPAIYDSNGVITPPGSYSMTINSQVSTQDDVHIMLSIKPPAGASTGGGTVYSLDYDTRPNDVYYIIT